MTRSELIKKLADRFPQFTIKDSELAVTVILDAMADTLSRGGRTEIRGFGSFCLNYRPPRMGRNPKNGVSVPVPGRYVPHFKAGLELRERVDYGSPDPSGSTCVIHGTARCCAAPKPLPKDSG